MISYLKGRIQYFNPEKIILNVQNVGYEINYFNQFTKSDYDIEVELYIVQKFSEYGVYLFGFRSVEEKIIFEILDSIKGVGSKAIFNIMAALEVNSKAKLELITLDALVKVPGVGKNTGQKFLLGLSNKLKKDFNFEDVDESDTKKDISNSFSNEINLLVEWGMKKSEVIDLLKKYSEEIKTMKSEEIIKFVLKNGK